MREVGVREVKERSRLVLGGVVFSIKPISRLNPKRFVSDMRDLRAATIGLTIGLGTFN